MARPGASPDPPAPFERIGPDFAATPLVYAVPHAGRDYPAALLERSLVPLATLEELEDRHADLLVARAVEEGAVAIVARVARAWIDLNRAEEDLDPALRQPPGSGPPASARSRAGLGLVPRRVGRRELWRVAPSPESAAARIAEVHRPYHAAVARALDDAWRRHGHAVLIDCHSMPPLAGARPARVVIGDRHGRTAAPGLAAHLAAHAGAQGFAAALNAPYAGAHGIERHARPGDGIHALQIEIDRSLYLAPDLRTVAEGIDCARDLVAALGRVAAAATRPTLDVAAE